MLAIASNDAVRQLTVVGHADLDLLGEARLGDPLARQLGLRLATA